MLQPVIQVSELRKSYQDLEAVKGISFEVYEQEIFGLLGPNGAGKTTTLEILETLREKSSGDVRLLGLQVERDAAAIKQLIGVQLQAAGYYPSLNLTELIELFSGLYNAAVDPGDLLRKVGLEDKSKAKFKELSGGQKQRFSIATTLINRPRIIFLDEPTTGLDPQARRNLWDLIRQVRDAGTTVVITTHYMDEAEQLCDRLMVMDKGKIMAEGSPAQLIKKYSSKEVLEVRFGSENNAKVAEKIQGIGDRLEILPDRILVYTDNGEKALEKIVKKGLHPVTSLVRRSSLEDVFLRLTGRSLVE